MYGQAPAEPPRCVAGPTALFNLWGTSGPHGCVCSEGWPSWSSGNKLRRDGWLRWLWACCESDDWTEACEKAAKISCSSNSNIPVTSGYHFLSTGLLRPAWSPFFSSQIKDTFLIILCQHFSPHPLFFIFKLKFTSGKRTWLGFSGRRRLCLKFEIKFMGLKKCY